MKCAIFSGYTRAIQADLRILAVNLGESIQAARKWARQLGLTYDVLLDRHGVVANLYQVRGLPTTVVLDGESRIRRLYYGPVTFEQLRRDVSRIGGGDLSDFEIAMGI